MDKFKIGSRVKLNSGGPTMTVREIEGENIVCSWFNSSKDFVQSHEFPAAMLTAVGDIDGIKK